MLAICAIVKDEGRYLREWLYYHVLQGVQRFYIYDNDSTDGTIEILEHFKAAGVLEYKNWPNVPIGSTQLLAYQDFMEGHPDMEEWVACIDADEFLYVSENQTVANWLEKLPEGITDTYQPHAILAPWVLYGSDGHEEYAPAALVKRFTARDRYLDQHVKTIIKPKYFKGLSNDVHSFKVDGLVMNTMYQPMPDATPTFSEQTKIEVPKGILRCNHLHTKSREEYRARCEKGRVDIPCKRDFETNFPMHDKNEVQDYGMVNFIEGKIRDAHTIRG